jgi:hypothetical protein
MIYSHLIDKESKHYTFDSWMFKMSEVTSQVAEIPETFVDDSDILENLADRVFGKYEELGGVLGMLTAGTFYSLTYPVTLVDGPAPFADAIWLAGLYRFSRAGYEIGSFVGSGFD